MNRPRNRALGIGAGVVLALGVSGVVALTFDGDTSAPTVSSSASTTPNTDEVAASAAQVAWSSQPAHDRRQLCDAYNADSDVALAAIDGGIGGDDPVLLDAFDSLLSETC
ncbi:MAG TPA: hypothetical protein VH419_08995 [Nocardioidaceae bacterium]|jgi:hypothetical protein